MKLPCRNVVAIPEIATEIELVGSVGRTDESSSSSLVTASGPASFNGVTAMVDTSTDRRVIEQRSIDRSASELFDLVWRRKRIVASCVVASTLLGAVYLHYAVPTYAVRARVLVQPERWPLNNRADSRPDKEFLATQAEIISSRAVIERVLPLATSHSELAVGPDPLLAVLEKLAVEPVTGTNVLSLSYNCQVPTEGIATVESILDSYRQFLQQLNDDSRLESLHLLTRSEEKLRTELEAREAAYLELRKDSPFVGRDRDATTFQRTILENLAEAVSEARQHRIDLENRAELLAQAQSSTLDARLTQANHAVMKVATRDPDGDVSVGLRGLTPVVPVIARTELDSGVALRAHTTALKPELVASVGLAATPEFEFVSRELLAAEMLERELVHHCGPKHPDLRAARERVATWKQRLQTLTEQAPAALQHELVVAKSRENQLLQLYDQELQNAKANDDFLVKESLELDGIERLKSIHNSIIAQMNDWQLVEPSEDGGMGAKVVVLEAPSIGTGPIWPKKSLLLSLCAAMGTLVGLAIVVVTQG
jgi:uncharacterized protein involved in exopolysaccharide biosynthesis